jgi:hypothetical protein
MADDDDALALDEGSRASKTDLDVPKKKGAEKSTPQTPADWAIRIALGISGLLLLVGFFLPWLHLGDLRDVSGLTLVISDQPIIRHMIPETQRYILLAIPVLGLALTAIGFLGFRWSGIVGAVVGILVIGYGVVTVVTIFFRTTAVGMWLMLGGSFLALGMGLFAVWRMRSAKAKGEEPAPEGD